MWNYLLYCTYCILYIVMYCTLLIQQYTLFVLRCCIRCVRTAVHHATATVHYCILYTYTVRVYCIYCIQSTVYSICALVQYFVLLLAARTVLSVSCWAAACDVVICRSTVRVYTHSTILCMIYNRQSPLAPPIPL